MKMNNNIYTDLQFYDNTYECKSRCLECVLLFLFPPIQMFLSFNNPLHTYS